jgi:hypothetical protein
MYRRRSVRREIEFSFDSFLDVVANVIGIVLRLILVAWVAGKGYSVIVPPVPLEPAPVVDAPVLPDYPEPVDEREAQWPARRQEIARQLRDAQEAETRHLQQKEALAILEAERAQIQQRRQRLLTAAGSPEESVRQAAATEKEIRELQDRAQRLKRELATLPLARPTAHPLRYQAPVAAEVQTEEVMFECRAGRVTPIDSASLLLKAQSEARERIRELEHAWEFTGVTQPVGAFRMRFVVERERESFDGRQAPSGGSFRYGFSRWELVAEMAQRGEDATQALKNGSVFRRITDHLDAEQVVATFWVYPDSFPLYRVLRDHLHERKFVVAGRPLPLDKPIAASRDGTRSRGQ